MLFPVSASRWTVVWAALALALGAGRVVTGCFLGSAEVTLADGSRRELHNIHEGDLVASWDESLRMPAVSAVRAVLEFDRDRSELVEISLPGAPLNAAADQPFWSRGRGSLVSLSPRAAREECGLDAELMGSAEELDGELQEAVPAALERRLPTVGESPPDPVTVMTLCLGPRRWFYAEGVRVRGRTPGEAPSLGERPAEEPTESEPRRLTANRRRRYAPAPAASSSSSSSGDDDSSVAALVVGLVIMMLFGASAAFVVYHKKMQQEQRLEALHAAQSEQAMETEEWDILMIRNGKLGFAFADAEDGAWMVKEVTPDGAMSQFNALSPDLAVRKGDFVTRINGEAPSKDGVSRIADGCTMTLTLRGKRASAPVVPAVIGQVMETKEWDITMIRSGKLGFTFADAEDGAWMVKEVTPDGAMSQFNACNPGLAVVKGDLVTRINGEAPSRDGVSRIADGCTMTLTLRGTREESI